MEIEEKIELNKKIKKYIGDDYWITAFQKQLKYKWQHTEEYNGKNIKVLTDKQYGIANEILNTIK